MFKKSIKVILVLIICLFSLKSTYAMQNNKGQVADEISQQTIAKFKRKIKKLIDTLPEEEKIKPGKKYNEILNCLCLNDKAELNENKLIQKLKDFNLIEDDKNKIFFIPNDVKTKLEKSLLNTKYVLGNMTMESNLNIKDNSEYNIVKEKEILREKLKNTTELTQRLIEFSDMQNKSTALLMKFLNNPSFSIENETIEKIEAYHTKMEENDKKIRELCKKNDDVLKFQEDKK